jgi:hypothetical protein
MAKDKLLISTETEIPVVEDVGADAPKPAILETIEAATGGEVVTDEAIVEGTENDTPAEVSVAEVVADAGENAEVSEAVEAEVVVESELESSTPVEETPEAVVDSGETVDAEAVDDVDAVVDEPVSEEEKPTKKKGRKTFARKKVKEDSAEKSFPVAERKLTRLERIAERERRKEERLAKQRKLDISVHDGITVGGRAQFDPPKARRLTIDKRVEAIARRNTMKLSIAGEDKTLSESSKYMLDMLVKEDDNN